MIGLSKLALFLGAALPPAALPTEAAKTRSIQVDGRYIVTLNNDIARSQIDAHLNWVSGVHTSGLGGGATAGVSKIWTENFKGYSGEFDEATLEAIKNNPDVAAVEPVVEWELYDMTAQDSAPWGLGSISHRDPNWSTYLYDDSAGEDMWAYVIDTGLYTDHVSLEGRGYLGYNAYPNSTFEDKIGHGTHCAGTIASKEYGVAKKAKVLSIRVFDTGSSTNEIVLDGYNWAVSNITNTPGRAATSAISMSLGGPKSDAFNLAVENAYQAGVLTVVAAGNNYGDAASYSPASAPNAVTVAAVDVSNTKASFSNTGTLVDIFAPGVNVLSAWIGSKTATNTISGTSMACPHVAGLALYLKTYEGLITPQEVAARLKELATVGAVKSPGTGAPNLLAFNGAVQA